VELPDGEEITTLAFFVLTQYRRVTDGRTERRTDGRTDGRTRCCHKDPLLARVKITVCKQLAKVERLLITRYPRILEKRRNCTILSFSIPFPHPFLPSLPPSLPFSLSSRSLSTVLLISVSSFPSYPLREAAPLIKSS